MELLPATASIPRPGPPSFLGRLQVALLVSACFTWPIAHAQSSTPARKIFVASFQGKSGTADLRDKVIARLRSSHEVSVVGTEAEADAVVHGSGETWIKGYVSVSPAPKASVRQPVYGGYLSLELQGKGGATLWSYLVTPGKLHWAGVDEDMADHIVKLMLAALKQAGSESSQPSAAPQAGQIALSGAGSTFSAPLYQQWIVSFEDRRPEVHATFEAVGSENGIHLLEEGKVDFAASDVPLSDEQLSASPVRFSQYATVLGGVVPAYNLPGIGRDLRFTPELLAAIYLGKVTRWNDPALREVNHGIGLPDEPILVLHRSDGSGTSFAWTEFLSRTSPEWKAKVGSGMRVAWPTGEGVEGNDAVAHKVADTPGAIGYMELTFAIRHELSFGLVRNAAGRFVAANLDTLSAAAAGQGDLRASLLNAPGRDAYPIASFTWILVPVSVANPQKSAALEDLLRWMLTSGQKECAGLGYLPLPKNLAERQLAQSSRSAAPAQ